MLILLTAIIVNIHSRNKNAISRDDKMGYKDTGRRQNICNFGGPHISEP